MVKLGAAAALAWATGLAFTLASPSPAPIVGVRTRNLPGMSDQDTMHAIWRRLASLAHGRRSTAFKNSTSLDKSWSGATLFSYTKEVEKKNITESKVGGDFEAELNIEVICAECYFKAAATAELTIDGEFDLAGTITNVTEQFGNEIKNLTKSAYTSLKAVAKNAVSELKDIFDDDDFRIEDVIDFNLVHIDTDIDIDVPPLPAVNLLFQIDNLDLYMAIDTTIAASATLTIPLYKSQSAVGVSTGSGLEIGIFVTMDLILSVEGELTLRSGFHLLLEKPIGFKLALFSTEVSELIFHGGKFEFLPVTIMRGNVALKAILRIGMHAGFELSTEELINDVVGFVVPDEYEPYTEIKMGMEVGVFATVAEFLTNITAGAQLAAEEKCALKIVQEYTMALGAAAGATVAIADHTWGPQPNTTIPVFYTTLANICAKTTTPPTRTTTAALAARQDDPNLVTQTISTAVLYTGVACASPELQNNCPASLRTTTILTTTKTLVTAVPKGQKATFPSSTALSVTSTIPFGKDVNKLTATSGVPVSYVPPPPPKTTSKDEGGDKGNGDKGDVGDQITEVWNGETGGVSNKLIIGLSVGLGVPIVGAFLGALVHWLRRKRYTPLPKTDTAVEYTGAYQSPMAAERQGMIKKGPEVDVGEVRH
ncbi:hypothetical protein C8A05DRAFT_18171 [Staphylotrichum tortipilum]|uniref:Mid2 domain-containing protein n=1 Tax=Staphylotrichum tortipilum TaxID=2831512 RepID=A0AAN6MFR9_9PEZI|nr:hypothetical protein C8A05DRAFT_18171 [Staphylotrichum longicolle]